MSAISVKDLAFSYGDVVAVDGVDLTVEPGQVLGVLGPNGAFPIGGSIPVDTNTNGGTEHRLALQAMVIDQANEFGSDIIRPVC